MLNVDDLAMTCNLPNYLGCYSGAGMSDGRVLLTADWSISGYQEAASVFMFLIKFPFLFSISMLVLSGRWSWSTELSS